MTVQIFCSNYQCSAKEDVLFQLSIIVFINYINEYFNVTEPRLFQCWNIVCDAGPNIETASG